MSTTGDAAGGPATLHETHLGRRRVMQLAGAAGAAALLGAHDDAPLAGDAEAAIPVLAFVPAAASVITLAAGSVAVSSALDWTDEPDNDNAITLYHMAQSVKESMSKIHDTILSNYLESMATMASIEARNALADEFEAGGTESECHDAATQAVWDFYDNLYSNELHAGIYALTQLGVIDNEENSNFWVDLFGPDDYSGTYGSGDGQDVTLTTEMEGVDIDLASGYAERVDAPKIDIEIPLEGGGTDTYNGVPIQEWIDNFDATNEETSLETDDGETITCAWSAGVPNVPRAGDDDLPSDQVFEIAEDWLASLQEIEDQASTVVGNYSSTFVGELYDLLDSGALNPSDVRGIEGMAIYMSGTDDVHDSRFQMAISSMLGVEGADLSNTAHMSVTYTGATGEHRPQGTDGSGEVHPKDFVTDEQWNGLLFGRDVPATAPGSRFAVAPTVYSGGADDEVHGIDASNGEQQWTYDGHSGGVRGVAVSPDGSMVYSGGADDEVHAIDASNGEQQWTYDGHSGGVQDVEASPDGSIVGSCSTEDVVHGIDASNGEQQWTYDGHSSSSTSIQGLEASPDGSMVYSAAGDGEVHAIGASTGAGEWTYEGHSGGVTDVGTMQPSGGALDGTISNGFFFDAGSGEEKHINNGVLEITSMQDSDGEEITLFDDDFIDEIEEESGRDIEDIVDSIDEIDSVDDLDDADDLVLVTNEVEGVSQPSDWDNINYQTWDEPDYDSYDSEEYTDYVDKVAEDLEEALSDSGDGGGGGGGGINWPDIPGGDILDSVVSVLVLGGVILFGWSIVSGD